MVNSNNSPLKQRNRLLGLWLMPVILALRILTLEDLDFETSLENWSQKNKNGDGEGDDAVGKVVSKQE